MVSWKAICKKCFIPVSQGFLVHLVVGNFFFNCAVYFNHICFCTKISWKHCAFWKKSVRQDEVFDWTACVNGGVAEERICLVSGNRCWRSSGEILWYYNLLSSGSVLTKIIYVFSDMKQIYQYIYYN